MIHSRVLKFLGVFGAAVSVLAFSGQAYAQKGIVYSQSKDWAVQKVESEEDPSASYCVLTNSFAQGAVLSIAQNVNEEASIGLDLKSNAFSAEGTLDVVLDPGAGVQFSRKATPSSISAIVIKLGKENSFFKALKKTGYLRTEIGEKNYGFNLSNIDEAKLRLDNCLFSIPRAVRSVEATPLASSPELAAEVAKLQDQVRNLSNINESLAFENEKLSQNLETSLLEQKRHSLLQAKQNLEEEARLRSLREANQRLLEEKQAIEKQPEEVQSSVQTLPELEEFVDSSPPSPIGSVSQPIVEAPVAVVQEAAKTVVSEVVDASEAVPDRVEQASNLLPFPDRTKVSEAQMQEAALLDFIEQGKSPVVQKKKAPSADSLFRKSQVGESAKDVLDDVADEISVASVQRESIQTSEAPISLAPEVVGEDDSLLEPVSLRAPEPKKEIEEEVSSSFLEELEADQSVPVAQPGIFTPDFAIGDVLEKASVTSASQVSKVDQASGPDALVHQWRLGNVYGSSEQRPVESDYQFEGMIQQYLSRTESRCAGDYAVIPDETLAATEDVQVDTYEIACVGDDVSSSASLLFVKTGNTFTVFAHEAAVEEMEQAMAFRDQISDIFIQ